MSPSPENPPRHGGDGWIIAVHASRTDHEPLGTGFLIDGHRVLTCAHVVCDRGTPRTGLWAAFPKSETLMGRRVPVVSVAAPPPENQAADDVAILELAEDVGIQFAARLRCPEPELLTGREWWSYGFSNRDMFGNPSSGTVGSVRGYGWVQLDVKARPGDVLAEGYSGAPLWSDAYQAVVGIIGQADERSSGRALTLWRVKTVLPDAGVEALADWRAEAAGESALAAWGWSLAADPEAGRHWRPRARGVSRDSEQGFRFRGRRRALTKLADWIVAEQAQRTALVVTGSPGVGKSAVLGRIVTSADRGIAAWLPAEDDAVRAIPDSVACAVHAKSKSALDVATEIAQAASASLPQQTGDLALSLRTALAGRPGRLFAVLIDALDEAASPKDARDIVRWIVRPLVEDLSDFGVRVVVGSRRRDNGGDLIGAFKAAGTVIDLDDTEYFELEDLEAYALASLQLLGADRVGNPYANTKFAAPVAARIAALSDKNFLVAGLIARAHGLYDTDPVRPQDISFSPKVDDALGEFLERIPPLGPRTAAELLTALAYAEAPGFTSTLWHVAVAALYGAGPGEEELRTFARASAANFLVEDTAGEGDGAHDRVYRLFHQALNDVLLAARDQIVPDEGALTGAFAEHGRRLGWDRVPAYLLRSLPGHAERGQAMDKLLLQDAYPLYADLRRLIRTALRCYGSIPAQQPDRLLLLRKALRTVDASPEVRAACFSLVEAQEQLGNSYHSALPQSPYRVPWAYAQPQEEQIVLEGHDGPVYQVTALPTEQRGRFALASCGQDGTIRVWDPDFGGMLRVVRAAQGAVNVLCTVPWYEGTALLASGGEDGTIQLWNPDTGENVRTLQPRRERIEALEYVAGPEHRQMLAALYADRSLSVWDLLTGTAVRHYPAEERYGDPVAFCLERGKAPAGTLLVCVRKAPFGFVYRWNPATEDEPEQILRHIMLPEESPPLLHSIAFGSRGRAIAISDRSKLFYLWDDVRLPPVLKESRRVTAICPIPMQGDRVQLALFDTRSANLLELDTLGRHRGEGFFGHRMAGFNARANAATTVRVADGSTLIATADDDSNIRLWQPLRESEDAPRHIDYGSHGAIQPAGDGPSALLYSVGRAGEIHAWLQATGRHLSRWSLPRSQPSVRCVIPREDGGSLLALQDLVGALIVAELETGRRMWTEDPDTRMERLHEPLVSMHAMVGNPRHPRLITAGDNGVIRVWDALTGQRSHPVKRAESEVREFCTVIGTLGESFLVAGCEDGVIRVWHLEDDVPLWRLRGHDSDPVTRVFCASAPGDTPLLGSISGDSRLRVWNLETGELKFSLERPDRWATRACMLSGNFDRTLIATAGIDRLVRIWGLDGHLIMEIPVRHEVVSMASSRNRLFLGLSDGIMAVDVDEDAGNVADGWPGRGADTGTAKLPKGS